MKGQRATDHRPDSWDVLVFCAVLVVTASAGVALIFGPDRWESSRSLTVVSRYLHLPWCVWGWVLIGLAAGLCNWRTRPTAYVITGMFASLFTAVSFFYTTLPGESSNIIVACFSLLSPLLLFAGGRYAVGSYRMQRRLRRLHA